MSSFNHGTANCFEVEAPLKDDKEKELLPSFVRRPFRGFSCFELKGGGNRPVNEVVIDRFP